MKDHQSRKLVRTICSATLGLIAIGIVAAPAVLAKPNSKSAAGAPANVVAHVNVPGGAVKQMLLVRKSGREFLVLGLDSASGIVVFDVSDPGKPRAIITSALASQAAPSELTLVADTLALFGDSAAAPHRDIKEIRSLAGVTASIKVRGLIYAANSDGLWIVKTREKAAADNSVPDSYGG